MPQILKLTPSDIDMFIAAGHPYAPVLAAMKAGTCTLMSVFQAPPSAERESFECPRGQGGVVASIGDDLDISYGPSAFDRLSLDSLLRDCNAIVLQVANFREDVMRMVAGSAALGLIVVVVETREQHEIEWFNYIKANSNVPLLVVSTRENPQ